MTIEGRWLTTATLLACSLLLAGIGTGSPTLTGPESEPGKATAGQPERVQSGAPERGSSEEWEGLVHRLRELSGAPGMAVSVADRTGEVQLFVSGEAVVEHGVSVGRDTRFRLASASKAVTSVLLAALASRDALELDRPVGDHLTDLPPRLAAVTPRQLAGHLAGIRGYEPGDTVHDLRRYAGPEEALSIFVGDPLANPPGESYGYTTAGYTLLAAAMEAATGSSYPVLLEELVTRPLGLESLGVDDPLRVTPGLTGFYERTPDGRLLRGRYVDPSHKVAGAGLIATAGDLARLGAALLDDSLLPASAREALFRSQRTLAGKPTGVGLGWRVGEDPLGRRVHHHEGSTSGARSALLVYPDEGLAVALLTNLTGTPLFAFESAAALVASALAPEDGACLAHASGLRSGEVVMDGYPAPAELRAEVTGGRLRGTLHLGETPLPVSREVPVLDGWCRGESAVLLLGVGPGLGLVPVHLRAGDGGLRGRTVLQGDHSLELHLAPGS